MRRSILTLYLTFIGAVLSAQTDTTDQVPTLSYPTDTAAKPAPKSFVFKPTLGLGVGTFSFFGDVYSKNLANFQVANIGYELSISQKIAPGLRLGFYTLFGNIEANERLLTRNVNFRSQIRVGGGHVEYNFDQLLKPNRNISPWISVGFESFEFLSKADVYDRNGLMYHYWSDGSIRSMPENDPFAWQASFLQRDYVYESDVRELNVDGFGKYAERSWAVPVGVGFNMHISEKWDARIGATIHFTFTDYVDGITENSVGARAGNSKNDHFVMSAFSIRYNLTGPNSTMDENGNDPYENVDYLAMDKDDYDGDGVIDFNDSCGETPKGVPVDAKGCPLDADGDLTADYRDDEAGTPTTLIADEYGVGLTDSMILYKWERYMDSTGKFAPTIIINSNEGKTGTAPGDKKTYMVMLGKYNSGISNAQMMKFLSVPDIATFPQSDSSTVYTAGKFGDMREAEKRRKQLEADGFNKSVIVYRSADGKFVEVNDVFVNNSGGTSNSGNNAGGTSSGGNNNSGNNAGNNSTAGNNAGNNGGNNNNSGNNNTSGNNSGNNSTAGNNSGGNNSGGNNSGNNNSGNSNSSGNTNATPTGPTGEGVVLRVQLGAYSRPLPKSVFRDVPDLIEVKTEDGLYKYMTGSFTNFQDAINHKIAMEQRGYKGAFVTAYKNGKRIPLSEAGAVYVKVEPEDLNENKVGGTDVKSMVEYRVQLGVYKNEPSEADKQKLNSVRGVQRGTTSQGLIRYTVGSSSDFAQVNVLKEQLRAAGFPDAFIIAFFKGEPISVPEARELQK
jgi:hypothetical protein